jgi:diadenosine tetraphosphatase ApaH/serine/threonine PP2A family protein phosphatase
MELLFSKVAKYCFMGHTHLPGVFTTTCEFIPPDECDHCYRLTGEKVMVNVGSVGQPRDDDNRSCYVIIDDSAGTITFRRVEYDFNITAAKIYGEPDLDNMLGDRIKHGR